MDILGLLMPQSNEITFLDSSRLIAGDKYIDTSSSPPTSYTITCTPRALSISVAAANYLDNKILLNVVSKREYGIESRLIAVASPPPCDISEMLDSPVTLVHNDVEFEFKCMMKGHAIWLSKPSSGMIKQCCIVDGDHNIVCHSSPMLLAPIVCYPLPSGDNGICCSHDGFGDSGVYTLDLEHSTPCLSRTSYCNMSIEPGLYKVNHLDSRGDRHVYVCSDGRLFELQMTRTDPQSDSLPTLTLIRRLAWLPVIESAWSVGSHLLIKVQDLVCDVTGETYRYLMYDVDRLADASRTFSGDIPTVVQCNDCVYVWTSPPSREPSAYQQLHLEDMMWQTEAEMSSTPPYLNSTNFTSYVPELSVVYDPDQKDPDPSRSFAFGHVTRRSLEGRCDGLDSVRFTDLYVPWSFAVAAKNEVWAKSTAWHSTRVKDVMDSVADVSRVQWAPPASYRLIAGIRCPQTLSSSGYQELSALSDMADYVGAPIAFRPAGLELDKVEFGCIADVNRGQRYSNEIVVISPLYKKQAYGMFILGLDSVEWVGVLGVQHDIGTLVSPSAPLSSDNMSKSFIVSNGILHAGDAAEQVLPLKFDVKSGEYFANIQCSDDFIDKLTVVHSSVGGNVLEWIDSDLEFTVESCTAGFFTDDRDVLIEGAHIGGDDVTHGPWHAYVTDPLSYATTKWQQIFMTAASSKPWTEMSLLSNNAGVFCNSGYGDGTFTVKIARENGEIVGLMMPFTEER